MSDFDKIDFNTDSPEIKWTNNDEFYEILDKYHQMSNEYYTKLEEGQIPISQDEYIEHLHIFNNSFRKTIEENKYSWTFKQFMDRYEFNMMLAYHMN